MTFTRVLSRAVPLAAGVVWLLSGCTSTPKPTKLEPITVEPIHIDQTIDLDQPSEEPRGFFRFSEDGNSSAGSPLTPLALAVVAGLAAGDIRARTGEWPRTLDEVRASLESGEHPPDLGSLRAFDLLATEADGARYRVEFDPESGAVKGGGTIEIAVRAPPEEK